MIKLQGLGRRRDGMSHEDCIGHHRNTHSKLGINQADHMSKYVLFYFTQAMSGTGTELADLPWDMSALEWMDDERWNNFMTWLEQESDGQEIKTDEATFLDRDRCYLCGYNETIVIDGASNQNSVNILRFIKAKSGVTARDAIAHHMEISVPLIKRELGQTLDRYVANYVFEPLSLTRGRIAESPVDIIEIYKVAPSAMGKINKISELFGSSQLKSAEAAIARQEDIVIFLAEEVEYIP